jgi:hypothetical protein
MSMLGQAKCSLQDSPMLSLRDAYLHVLYSFHVETTSREELNDT